MKKFLKKHKVGVIVLGVLIALGVVIGVFINKVMKQANEILASMQNEVAVVERRDLVNVVSGIGTIKSAEAVTVTAEVSGMNINSLLVQVGDYVNQDDLLCVLDSEKLEDSLAQAEKTLSNAESSANININSASRALTEAQTNGQITIDRYDQQVKDAKKKIEDYEKLRDQSSEQYWAAVNERQGIEARIRDIQATIASLTLDISNNDISGDDVAPSQARIVELTNALPALQSQLAALTANESSHIANYNNYVAMIEQAESSLKGVEQNKEDAIRTNDSTIAARKDSVSTAKLSKESSLMNTQNQIDTYEDQIENCSVCAPISGIVTSIAVEEGQKYAGTALMVIEDTSSFEIATQVDEYDISKIEVGQRVVIKTNATGDSELEGHVKSIAPRALQTNSSVANYQVIISIDTKCDDLRMDMTAKYSIVLSESKNALTVPYDAIQYDDEENAYVQRKMADGTTKDVYITLGIMNDFYAEVLSNELKEGDEIIVIRDLAEVFDFASMIEVEGADGGM